MSQRSQATASRLIYRRTLSELNRLPEPTFNEGIMQRITKAAATVAAGLLITTGVAMPAQAADPIETATKQSFTDSNGNSSWYHVYADDIDWSQDVGALYYFDGDYFSEDPQYSQIMKPQGEVLQSVAQNANDKNLVLFAAKTPSPASSANGWTWWENGTANAQWVDDFATAMQSKGNLDTDHTWLAGYSGGAELISFDLMTQDRSDWMTDGGAILIAGGGSGSSTVPSAANSHIPMTWYAGSDDGPGQTNPPEWSALGAAEEGSATYQSAGYNSAVLEVLPGVGHHGYDLAGLINQTTEAAATKTAPPTQTPEPEPTPEPTPTEPEPTDPPKETPPPSETPEPTPTETQSKTPTPTETPTVDEDDEDEDGVEEVAIDSGNPTDGGPWGWVAGIGGIALIGAGIAYFFMRRKKLAAIDEDTLETTADA